MNSINIAKLYKMCPCYFYFYTFLLIFSQYLIHGSTLFRSVCYNANKSTNQSPPTHSEVL